jgi:hypothetical protein
MPTSQQEAKCIMWFNKTKCLKQVQLFYRAEFRVHPLSKPSIYTFYKSPARHVV